MIRQSHRQECRFIFPLLDDLEICIEYEGLYWRNETSDLTTIEKFSESCYGFEIGTFENSDNIFVYIVPKVHAIEEKLEVIFESRLNDDLPCAFYDEQTKSYDDFFINPDVESFSITSDENALTITTKEYDPEDELDDEQLDDPIDIFPQNPVPVLEPKSDELEDLKVALNHATDRNNLLQGTITSLEKQIESLNQQLNNPTSVNVGGDASLMHEIERLKTLISQLVDKDYSSNYIQTCDSNINEMTKKVQEQKEIVKEKELSLSRLETEYSDTKNRTNDISANIKHTMDLLHKAESVQKESSTELSIFQKRLNDILNELNIDVSTLEMYETQDGIDALILESNDLRSKIETKLKVLIATRQKDSDDRFNNVTS